MTDQPERQPDLCQASITNEHSDGIQRCTLPAAHHGGEYGQHHAGPNHPKIGRLCWTDTAIGAVPHQDAPEHAEPGPRIPECLNDACTMGCTTECRAVINAAWRTLNPTSAERAETFHGCPPDGSGLTPCCGRTPFELPPGDDLNGALIEDYLRFLRGQGPEPDLSDLPTGRREAITGQFEIVRALADRDPSLPPLDRDPVARRLGLHQAAVEPAGLRERIVHVLRTTPSTGNKHKPGEKGHTYTYTCALCRKDVDALADAVLAVRDRELEQLRAQVAWMDASVQQAWQDAAARDQALEQLRARVRRVADLIERGAPWTANLEDTARRVRAAVQPQEPAATPAVPPKHIGNGANAEDCPACSGTNLPYPWVCPGESS